MSATAHQLLSDALLARLLSQGLAYGRVYANRLMPVPQSRTSAVVLRRESAVSREVVLGGVLDWSSTYAVECYGRGAVGEDPARAVDELLAQTWACLLALSPADLPSLSVMGIAPESAVEWQFDEAETPAACAIVRFTVRHRTGLTNLQPWNPIP